MRRKLIVGFGGLVAYKDIMHKIMQHVVSRPWVYDQETDNEDTLLSKEKRNSVQHLSVPSELDNVLGIILTL